MREHGPEEIALLTRARYHTKMKKATLTLTIRRETLRVLSDLDLGRAAGGRADARLMDTEGPNNGCQIAKAAYPVKLQP